MTAPNDLVTTARNWLAEDPDPSTRAELQDILDSGDMDELGERFGTRLEFGTAGLRGVLGSGPNRMNRSLVRRVTAGLARYLLAHARDAAGRGVVVGYDGRRMSREFAEDTASVLAGAGIRVHRFSDVATTPLTAYAVTALDAAAGIVVTASHNPPEYNGYKVYWENGAQIIPPHDAGISRAIDEVGSLESIPRVESGDDRAAELILPVADSVGEDYFRSVLDLQLHPDTPRAFPVVYTPLHGVGGASVAEVFARAGYTGFSMVPEQAQPDGEFPTVNFPNPEEPGAMDLAQELAADAGADLILANDPDADRLAVVVRKPGGDLQPLTGNQIGTLLAHYLLTQGDTAGDRLVCTTIVSSGILQAMAERLGVAYGETLTGFKWIANHAIDARARDGRRFVFGFEEALGYTVGALVRDKDGVSAALVFADLAAWRLSRGSSVLEYLDEIFDEFGLYHSAQKSLTLPGTEGLARIEAMMRSLRETPPVEVAGSAVRRLADIQLGTETDLESGQTTSLELPASNVLRYVLADGTRILARPSGTEPKIKVYVEVCIPVTPQTRGAAKLQAGDRVTEVLAAFVDDLQTRA